MSAHEPTEQRRHATYLTLMGTFLTLFGLFASREQRRQDQPPLTPFDFALLGLAVFRGGRLIAYDHVIAPLREPFTETVPDASGAGDTVEPEGHGAQRALGELLACPICAGTWVAAGLTYGLRILPAPTRLLMTILAATGAAEWLNASVEAMSWFGQAARREVGVMVKETEAHAAETGILTPDRETALS
ncbi:MAG: DUF1360 domain-containing protein [Anaerolineae bacterium]|nr:DUF1360 domain-containing protein [Anaerolineae bacterium]